MMPLYVNPEFQAILAKHDYLSFDRLWALETPWFEAPNERRGGWSGVSKCAWERPEGGTLQVFLKRQENHNTKTWRHPIQGVPTYAREMENILTYQRYQIPALNPVYFAQRKEKGKDQAILVTESLEGYQSFEAWIQYWQANVWPSRQERKAIICEIARIIRLLHQHRLQHTCLYPKHLFMRLSTDVAPEVRIIDLESTRHRNPKAAMIRDLSSFYRHLGVNRISDQVRFFRHYFDTHRLTVKAKQAWRMIDAKARAK